MTLSDITIPVDWETSGLVLAAVGAVCGVWLLVKVFRWLRPLERYLLCLSVAGSGLTTFLAWLSVAMGAGCRDGFHPGPGVPSFILGFVTVIVWIVLLAKIGDRFD